MNLVRMEATLAVVDGVVILAVPTLCLQMGDLRREETWEAAALAPVVVNALS